MHKLYFCLLCLLSILTVSAEKRTAYQKIKGCIMLMNENKQQEPLPYANLSILLMPDSTFVAGGTSDETGHFQLQYKRNPQKKYVLKASYLGCVSLFQEITTGKDNIDLGTFALQESSRKLEEVVVTAVRQPVEQRGDTTVYNAEAYKIPEGAYLEELVRRIPGLNYDPKEKTMKYKGEPIQEITVNGKEFFKGNNRVALENIPAHFVSRLKVYDKSAEEEKLTGIKGQEKNYVLDLQTAKEVNGSLMTGLEGGYGNKHKFDSRGQIFQFKDNGENIGLVGSFGNRNITSAYPGNRNGNLGGNLSKNIGEKLKLSASLNYVHSRQGDESTSRNEQYMSGKEQYGVSENLTKSQYNGLSSSANIIWDISKKTMFHASGSMNLSRSRNETDMHSAKFSEHPGTSLTRPFDYPEDFDPETRMNEIEQQNHGRTKVKGFNLFTSLTHQLSEKGNSLQVSFSSSLSRRKEESFRVSTSTFYLLQNIHGNDSVDYRNQYQHLPVLSRNNEIQVAYTHKLSKTDHLQFSYAFNSQHEEQTQDTYDLSAFAAENSSGTSLEPGYEQHHIDSLSNRRQSRTYKHLLTLSYAHEGEVWNIYGGISLAPQQRKLKQEERKMQLDTLGNSLEWAPRLSVNYRKNDYDLGISYNGNTQQPSLQELMAPTVYHSALYVTRSNPNLKPSYQHSLSLTFSNYTKGFSSYLLWRQEINSVTQASRYIPQTGGRETYPVNLNGNWGINGSFNYEHRFNSLKIGGRGGGNFNRDMGLIDETGDNHLEKSVTKSSGMDAKIEISYLPAWGNIDLSAGWDFMQYKNSLNTENTYDRNYTIGSSLSAQLPLRIRISSDFAYQIRSGSYVNSDEENEALWNLKVGWKFAKEQRMELSLLWADILNQRKSLRRTASPEGFYEYYTQQLGSYFMISLQYRFNRMN